MDKLQSFVNSFSTATPPAVSAAVGQMQQSIASSTSSSSSSKQSNTQSKLPVVLGGVALATSAYLAYKLFFTGGLGAMSRSMFVSHRKEEDLLRYVVANAKEGDVDSVINTIDQFCYSGNWMMNVGDVKGEILDAELKKKSPMVVLELGAYCGYSALRIARHLTKPGSHLYSIEIDALNAAIATKIIEFAGLKNKVTFIIGTVETRLAYLQQVLKVNRLDLIFIDHLKTEYKPDLIRLEQTTLIQNGSVIVADNCLYPGCPDYVQYITSSANYESVRHETKLEYCDKDDHIWVSTRK